MAYDIRMAYVQYEKDGDATWKCKNPLNWNATRNSTYEDAIKACNKNPSCKYIENEDCAGTEGYSLCTSLIENSKSCVFEKNDGSALHPKIYSLLQIIAGIVLNRFLLL